MDTRTTFTISGRRCRVLMYEKDGIHYAHDIDTDILTRGSTRSRAISVLKSTIESQIAWSVSYCKRSIESIDNPAPKDIQERYLAAREQKVDLPGDQDT